MLTKLKYLYWNIPGISRNNKEMMFYKIKKVFKGNTFNALSSEYSLEKYRDQILNIPTMKSNDYYCPIINERFNRENDDIKLFAFYLPQMYPTPENDEWWGKGVTEWNNVCRAVPQFIGHYQPRLPGELGFYDLRLKENLVRQTELANLYGVFGFCFYYYWFDGRRLLDKPLDLFVQSKDIDLPFCLCWANESWRSTFSSGSAETILVTQSDCIESYKNFIKDFSKYLLDERYYAINGKKVILIYQVLSIPNPCEVLDYWREWCKTNGIGELYIIGCWRPNEPYDLLEKGFDAAFEFQAASILPYCMQINSELEFAGEEFFGRVYSYRDVVEQEIYKKNYDKEKLYHSIFPMWDNTPRRNNHGSLIFHDSNPELYKKWLKYLIHDNKIRSDIDDNFGFINSWNEWGEGSYIEPDKYYGYAYLNATREAIEECR